MAKTYRSRDSAKRCHWEGCKRKVHAHFGKLGYCSSHYSAKWRENLIIENKLLKKLIRLIEKSLHFKCKDPRIKELMADIKELEEKYENKIDEPFQKLMLLSTKRAYWGWYAGIKPRI